MSELFGVPVGIAARRPRARARRRAGALVGARAAQPVLLKLGVRNVSRRAGAAALIVVGLMLGTTIIAAALVTGDTMATRSARP